MKGERTIYWITTGALCLLFLFSAAMYLFNHSQIVAAFTGIGYPTYLIYPLAIAKILAVAAILSKKSKLLKEWAYAGFFYILVLAFFAHIAAKDGMFAGALIGLIVFFPSYFLDKKLFK